MASKVTVTGIVMSPMPVPIQLDFRSAGGASATSERTSGAGDATGSES
jgi:hypothetical protein